MVTRRRKPAAGVARGFTLIELMIGLALSAILALTAVPFTVAWYNSARQLQVRGDLVDAVSRAKSVALRNSALLPVTAPVTRVRVTGAQLTVEDAAAGTVLWQAELPGSAALELADGTAFQCVAFNNRGWMISVPGCTQVANQLVVKLNHAEDLNVDLL